MKCIQTLISHSAVLYACGHCWRVVSGWGWWPVIIGAICAIIPPALLLSVNTNPFILIIISLIVQPLASTEHQTTRMYRKCCQAFFYIFDLFLLVKTEFKPTFLQGQDGCVCVGKSSLVFQCLRVQAVVTCEGGGVIYWDKKLGIAAVPGIKLSIPALFVTRHCHCRHSHQYLG